MLPTKLIEAVKTAKFWKQVGVLLALAGVAGGAAFTDQGAEALASIFSVLE